MKVNKSILIAPLNWGLGHATRCIPIIRELLRSPSITVILASDGRALQLLRQEFPNLTALELPAYQIHYRSTSMIWNIAGQVPKILRAIYQEQQAIKQLVRDYKIDLIISDNRYGCYHPAVRSIFMTHQINLRIPFRPLEYITNRFNYLWLKKFETVWIPDYEGETNLAGNLSRSAGLEEVVYLGALSRFKKKDIPIKYDVIVVLSGPEPQRSILEQKIIEQTQGLPYQFLLVQGKTEVQQHFFIKKNIEVRSFLNSVALNEAILASKIVVARSGYSTLMDLMVLGKKAIFIPTPGQTEQEYLAATCQQINVSTGLESRQFYSQSQESLDLQEALQLMMNADEVFSPFFEKNHLSIVISRLLTSLER